MASVMRDDDQHMAHRIEAAKWLTDRSEGKAVDRSVMVKIDQSPGNVRVGGELTDEALAQLIRGLSDRAQMPAQTLVGNAIVTWHEPGSSATPQGVDANPADTLEVTDVEE
jgi:hypothetical protein